VHLRAVKEAEVITVGVSVHRLPSPPFDGHGTGG